MRSGVIDAEGFEAKFRDNLDPWNYAASPFEAYKRRILLEACGTRHYGRGLEIACAIGETTRVLAPRCLRLLAEDASPTAIEGARRRTRECRNVTVRHALLPRDAPRGPFDLIVASEIFYYLASNDLRLVLIRLWNALAPGGRIVILHHLRDFDDAAIPPSLAQRKAFTELHRRMKLGFFHQTGRFQVAAFDRPLR